MRNKKLLISILLILILLLSITTYVYVERQQASGVLEKAQASEITQSQLEVIEQQLPAGTLTNNIPQNSTTLTNTDTQPQDTNQPQNSTTDTVDTEALPQTEFVNRKPPQISESGAQTTVNLIITNPDAEATPDE